MIGITIQANRKKLGYTQAHLAEMLGVTPPAVNRWEKGLSYPDADMLAPLARALEIDMNELFSFHAELTEKERDVIIHKLLDFQKTAPAEGYEDLLSYVNAVIHEHPSDAALFKKIADLLSGINRMMITKNKTMFTETVVFCYERALELNPEYTDEVSYSLMGHYAALNMPEKAEECWQRIHASEYDKRWIHAELMYETGQFDKAEQEMKAAILNTIINLNFNLVSLGNAAYKNGSTETVDAVREMAQKFRDLFGIWEGINALAEYLQAVAADDPKAFEIFANMLLEQGGKKITLTTLPLFEGIDISETQYQRKGELGPAIVELMKSLEGLKS